MESQNDFWAPETASETPFEVAACAVVVVVSTNGLLVARQLVFLEGCNFGLREN